jgi:hypothetical protein
MTFIRLVLALLFTVAAASCTPMRIGASLSPSLAADLKSGKIATSFVVAKPRMRSVSDTLLLVTIKTDTTTATLEGIWDMNPDLTKILNEQFTKAGYSADPIFGADIDSSAVSAYTAAIASQYQAFVPDSKRMHDEPLPPQSYFLETPKGPEFDTVRQQLLGKGYTHLVEMTGQDIQTPARFGFIDVVIGANLRVIDLKTQTVVYAELIIPAERSDAASYAELEANDLAKLKATASRAVAKAVSARLEGLY